MDSKALARRAIPLAAVIAAVLVASSLASANAGDPDSTSATWKYVSGSSGPVEVTVTGTWSWGDNAVNGGGKDSQSCLDGKTVSQTDINGHYAVGIAVAWGDASTPNALSGKTADGRQLTILVGSQMDWTNPNYCAGTTADKPYPSGTFSATHQYPSYAEYQKDTNNGQMCANAYDVHKPNDAKESDPSHNGDNTLANGHYSLTTDCAAAQPTNPPPPPPTTPSTPSPPSTPSAPSAPAAPSTPAAPAAPATPTLAIVKTERDATVGGGFTGGPLHVHVGDRIDYEIVVTNTSSVALNVLLDDPGCQIRGGARLHFVGIQFAPGQKLTYHCSHVVTSSDGAVYTNTATANGISASASAAPVSSSVTANVTHVLGAKKVIVHTAKPKPRPKTKPKAKPVARKAVKHVTKVTHKAKPATPVVKSATYTG